MKNINKVALFFICFCLLGILFIKAQGGGTYTPLNVVSADPSSSAYCNNGNGAYSTASLRFFICNNNAWVAIVGNTNLFNAAGTQAANGWVVSDKCTLGTNCAVTFVKAFTSGTSYQCAGTDQTAAAAVKVVNTSATVATFTGTGTDVISFVCAGN